MPDSITDLDHRDSVLSAIFFFTNKAMIFRNSWARPSFVRAQLLLDDSRITTTFWRTVVLDVHTRFLEAAPGPVGPPSSFAVCVQSSADVPFLRIRTAIGDSPLWMRFFFFPPLLLRFVCLSIVHGLLRKTDVSPRTFSLHVDFRHDTSTACIIVSGIVQRQPPFVQTPPFPSTGSHSLSSHTSKRFPPKKETFLNVRAPKRPALGNWVEHFFQKWPLSLHLFTP